MKLTILGSGTCVPSTKRASPANYIETKNVKALVDCGSGTLRQLAKAGKNYQDIDVVFVTHEHPDHTIDLNALIQALNWTPGFTRKKDLTLVGYPGLKKFYTTYFKPRSGAPRPHTFKLRIHELTKKWTFKDLAVEYHKTLHTDMSIAYKFTSKGKTLIISGDCEYEKGLSTFAKDVDILLLECSFANAHKDKGHLVAKECGRIARDAHAKRLILTHLYPPVSTEITRLKQAKTLFKNTVLAEDLMQVDVA